MRGKINLDTITKYSIIIGMVLITSILLYKFIIAPQNEKIVLEKKEKFIECVSDLYHQKFWKEGERDPATFHPCISKCGLNLYLTFCSEEELKELIRLEAGAKLELLRVYEQYWKEPR